MSTEFAVNWTAVIIVAAIGVMAVLFLFALSRIVAPRRPSSDKQLPYECGIRPSPFQLTQVRIRYYVFAILFLVFDVEAIFLFPWAMIFAKSNPIVFYEMILFMAILIFGLIYAWQRKVLNWG